MEKGVVRLSGKDYKTVALRVSEFRTNCPADQGWAITTEFMFEDDNYIRCKAMIANPAGTIVAVGHSESRRQKAQKLLEKTETVAIGRALSAFGLGGDEYASADEIMSWVESRESQVPKAAPRPAQKHPVKESADREVDDSTEGWVITDVLTIEQFDIWREQHGKPSWGEMHAKRRGNIIKWFGDNPDRLKEAQDV